MRFRCKYQPRSSRCRSWLVDLKTKT